MTRTPLVSALMCAAFSAAAPDPAPAATPVVAPFGSWKSPIAAEMLVAKSVRFGDLSIDGDTLYWTECRPEEQGRAVIVRRTPDGKIDDVLPPPLSARTTANEYGGGAFLPANGVVYFSNYADQRIWQIKPGQVPEPLTHGGKQRFADYVLDTKRNRLISVSEDHSREDAEPVNRIVAIDLATGSVTPLVEGADFYSTPCVSPDGGELAWLAWHHPNMPWDGTELYVAPIAADGTLGPARLVAGGKDESIFQPAWSPDGTLHFVSDRTNWWNLYAERDGTVTPIWPMEAEFGVPQWVFGYRTYGFLADDRIVARYTTDGVWRLTVITPTTGKHAGFDLPYSSISNLAVGRDSIVALMCSPTEPESIVAIDPASGTSTVLAQKFADRRRPGLHVDPASDRVPHRWRQNGPRHLLSAHEPRLSWPGGREAAADRDDSRRANVGDQRLVSRIDSVLDVARLRRLRRELRRQHRLRPRLPQPAPRQLGRRRRRRRHQCRPLSRRPGAGRPRETAHPRRQRRRLHHACRTRVRRRLPCRRESTTASAIWSYWRRDTHKFESRYLDRLVGPYPEQRRRYRDRSPIHHLDGFAEPVILLQGLEDKVVPPNQAEAILEVAAGAGRPGGLRAVRGRTARLPPRRKHHRAQEAELYFYSRILGFPLAEKIEPVEIYNMPGNLARQRINP